MFLKFILLGNLPAKYAPWYAKMAFQNGGARSNTEQGARPIGVEAFKVGSQSLACAKVNEKNPPSSGSAKLGHGKRKHGDRWKWSDLSVNVNAPS